MRPLVNLASVLVVWSLYPLIDADLGTQIDTSIKYSVVCVVVIAAHIRGMIETDIK